MKMRLCESGIHFFDPSSGLNILFDEVDIPQDCWDISPQFLSVALTNACDLKCTYCYAPKHRAKLDIDDLTSWLIEFDKNGGLSVGFGGGEPTLYPHFEALCYRIHSETNLGLSFTTHGHQLTPSVLKAITGKVHFVRVSMDGVRETYENHRGRKFGDLLEKMRLLSDYLPFGVNVVVNEQTICELDCIAEYASNYGAKELLLLPELDKDLKTNPEVLERLNYWTLGYPGPLTLAMSEHSSVGFQVGNPFMHNCPLSLYAHIDASGKLKKNSFSEYGISLKNGGFLTALEKLRS